MYIKFRNIAGQKLLYGNDAQAYNNVLKTEF